MAKVDAWVISTDKNLSYFCGGLDLEVIASGVFLVMSKNQKILITNMLEKFNIPNKFKKIVYHKKDELKSIFRRLLKGKKRIGLEGKSRFSLYIKLKKWLPGRRFFDISDEIAVQRAIKKPAEIKNIKTALKIAETGIAAVIIKTTPGMSEKQIMLLLKQEFMKHGSETNFCIVQADGNASKIHKQPSEKRLRNVLLLDVGPVYKSYTADITRTFFFGKKTKLQQEVYEAVLSAQKAAFQKIKPGAKASEVYNAAKLALGKYSKYFTHGLGHGIGLDVHEAPSLSEASKDVLKPGMVFTIEPGVYLPGKFGVRIEDVVLVTKKEYKLLTHFKK